ncbi:hypothetical protein D3C79_47950 [compost metagenome]
MEPKTKVVTVPLGMVKDIFTNHGLGVAEIDTLLNFLVQIWLANEPDIQEDLTKDTIELLKLDPAVFQLLLLEVIPHLVQIGILVHSAIKDATLSSFSIKDHVIYLELFDD